MCPKLLRLNLIQLQTLLVWDLNDKFDSVTTHRYFYLDTIYIVSPEAETSDSTLKLMLDLVKNIATVLKVFNCRKQCFDQAVILPTELVSFSATWEILLP
ncbi:hypothetical protein ILYODFUR_015171 [Ilyodon furcidens]|uniref:Uncharacterized protein n=1 Tax=Ilyodon furcidens TaxID=33524 RepID=A0ABV0U9T4_9TELE